MQEQQPQQNRKKALFDIALIVFSLLLVVGGVAVIRFYPQSSPPKQPDNNVNVNDLPTGISTTTSKEEVSIPLIYSDYVPPQDIYINPVSYDQNVVRLALIGEFETVKLKIVGTINNDFDNFLSINIGDVSGTLGGYRNSANTLDIEKSIGIFNKKNPLNINIDLQQSVRLSTTREEYSSSFEPFKQVILWDRIKPPSLKNKGTIAKMVLAPYSERGIYGDGIVINKIDFVYSCLDGKNSCGAVVCDKKYKLGSDCLKKNFNAQFGTSSWKYYADYFNN